MAEAFLKVVRAKARQNILFLPHAVRQMNRPDRMITPSEVKMTVLQGEIIEEYPEDARGHSCLLLSYGEAERPLHVVCAPKQDYLVIITAYLPDVSRWSGDFRTRREP